MSAWELLGIEPTQDMRAIKRAYSVKLKTTRPDDDAEAYQSLREAYDWALSFAKFSNVYEIRDTDEEESPVQQATSASEPEPGPPLTLPIEESEQALELPHVKATEVIAQEAFVQGPTVESVMEDCTKVWYLKGGAGLSQAWPGIQAQLEQVPIAQYQRASRAFAQFVSEESDLPVDVLVALTRHFQWGLDFRADQLLGPQLSHALHQKLDGVEVFAAFRPERFTQHVWALELAKLWDNNRRVWARLLALGLDCSTRHRILSARLSTLRALGASRASAPAVQGYAAQGGAIQCMLFLALVACLLALLYESGVTKSSFTDVIGLGIAAAMVWFVIRKAFPGDDGLSRQLRRGRHLDWIPFVPLVPALLIYVDRHFDWLSGYSGSAGFLVCISVLCVGLWLVSPTEEQPWRELVLPAFVLLLFGLRELLPAQPATLLISLAFAWVMAAHVVLRRYPEKFDWVYENLLKLGLLRAYPLFLLGAKYLAAVWVLMAVVLLPALLFRMAANYRVLYAAMAMGSGVLLGNIRGPEGQTQYLLVWVLGVVLFMQVMQAAFQHLSEYGLNKAKLLR